MRKLSFVVVFLLVQLNVFAQSAELEVWFGGGHTIGFYLQQSP